MKSFMKWGAVWLLMGTLALGTTGCGDDDPSYDNVTPPTVVAKYTINGRVLAVNGEGLVAKVTLDGSTTIETAADGSFTMKVEAGTHTLKAEAEGKLAKEKTVEVTASENGEAVAWNVVLTNAGQAVTVAADGSATGKTNTETLKGNEQASIEVDLTAAEGSLPAGSTITMTSFYSFNTKFETKAGAERQMLAGVNLSSSDATELSKPVAIDLNVGAEMAEMVQAYKQVDGEWVSMPCAVDGDKVRLEADALTSYALSFDAEISSSLSKETIELDSKLWDNLSGSGDLQVSDVGYSYKHGLDLKAGANRMQAYLVELLGQHVGSSSVGSWKGSYDLDVTLPVGTGMNMSASQAVLDYTATAGSYSASAKYYGNVTFNVTTYNRQHTGGGSL